MPSSHETDNFIAHAGLSRSDASQHKSVFENIFGSILLNQDEHFLCASPFLLAHLRLFRDLRRALSQLTYQRKACL
jgi:hypothetical protein